MNKPADQVMASSSTIEAFDISTAKLKPGTVAIVTGAAEGMGRSFAEGLLQKGAKGVSLADVNITLGLDTLREFTKLYGEDRVIFVKCDVTSSSDMEALFVKTKETFGTVNLVVNNAGIDNEVDYESTINVNVMGVTRGTFLALKYMGPEEGGQGGKVITIASKAAFLPVAVAPVYAASMFAMLGLTKSMMIDTRIQEQGITFGMLCPGFVDTNFKYKCVYRHQADKRTADEAMRILGVLDVSQVKDAFLQLVIDDSWSGKVMVVTKQEGIYEHI